MVSDADVALRFLVTATLGSAVGFKRERLLWAAGIRTHLLVAVGSWSLMIVLAYGFQYAVLMPHVVLDPSRVAAQVVSRIGLLAAGPILLRGNVVHGLTMGATAWAVAAIRLASGGGLYVAAAISTIIILAIPAWLKPLEEACWVRVQGAKVQIEAEHDAIAPETFARVLGARGSQITQTLSADVRGSDARRRALVLAGVSSHDLDRIQARQQACQGVERDGEAPRSQTPRG